MKFQVVIEEYPEDGGYIVHCPVLKGCWSQGDTVGEALGNIKEAIVGYLKTLNERAMHGLKSPDKALVKGVAGAVPEIQKSYRKQHKKQPPELDRGAQ